MSLFGLLVGIPALVVALLAARTLGRKGVHPDTYAMSDSWAKTHPPILWAATDETVGAGHGHGHGTSEFSIGGGVSGKW